MHSKEFYDRLISEFGSEIVLGITDAGQEQIIDVKTDHILDVCSFLAKDELTQLDSLSLLTGVDDANGKNVKNDDGSETVSGATLSVIYHLESFLLKHFCVLRVSVSVDNPVVPSVITVLRSADWHEREAYDLIGIHFDGHPDLRRILMPYDWEFGHPLRKDYKNPEFYQGMKVPY